MSNYRNFVSDFPHRCRDVLLRFEGSATATDREVTLMLMAASAGFVVPFERLRAERAFAPPIHDRERYTDAAEQMRALLQNQFVGSQLWLRGDEPWLGGPLDSVHGYPDVWPELRHPQPLPETESVESVLSTVRNPLAHGNLYTQPEESRIASLVFVTGGISLRSGRTVPYRFVQTSPQNFRTLLLNWFDFLSRLRLPSGVIGELLAEAA